MQISIDWHDSGKYPSFNVNLHKVEGAEPFLSIKGCRIVQGSKGEFVSWPATKNERTGKYWNHVYAGEAFGVHVLKLAKDALPKTARPTKGGSGFDDMADDPPF